jgi:hypothetical protein
MKYYWLVMPEYYRVMNKILNSNFADSTIKYFIDVEKHGVYVTLEKVTTHKYWGFMPCIHPNDKKDSKDWLEIHDYEFKYEISRKSKLNMINKIYK